MPILGLFNGRSYLRCLEVYKNGTVQKPVVNVRAKNYGRNVKEISMLSRSKYLENK